MLFLGFRFGVEVEEGQGGLSFRDLTSELAGNLGIEKGNGNYYSSVLGII